MLITFRHKRTIGAAFALVLLVAGDAHATLINGDFSTFVPKNGTGGGWTSSNIDSVGGWMSTGGNPGGNFILNHSGFATTDPTISQAAVGLTIGQEYLVTGQYEPVFPASGNPSSISFGVLLDGVAILELASGPLDVYTDFSVTFLATNSTHTVGFAAERNSSDSSFRVDNLALNPAPTAVPEPASLALIACGTCCLAAYRWSRGRARTSR